MSGSECPVPCSCPVHLLISNSFHSRNFEEKREIVASSGPTPELTIRTLSRKVSVNKLQMENYSKGKNVEEPLSVDSIPIPNLPQDLFWMHVRGGSKMRKVLEPALKAFNESKSVLWTGEGPSLGKAISCAEVMKRKFESIHQFNHICYRRCQEFWDPKFEGMDPLVVNRDVPVIHILLSREPINKELPGYQPPKGSLDSKRPQEKRRSKPKKFSGNQEEMEKFGLRFDKRKPKKPRQNQTAHED